MSTRTDHDGSYRRLFGHRTMVRSLLEYVVGEELGRALDFDRMTRMETDFLSESLRRRESDAIWRVGRREGSDLVVLVMLEFQSSVDAQMALRILEYTVMLHRSMLAAEAGLSRLAPVLPIVLYNGGARWTAATTVQEMIEFEPLGRLAPYQPHQRYLLIDEVRLGRDVSGETRNLAALLFRLEGAQTHQELPEGLVALVEALRGDTELGLLFLTWFEHVVYHRSQVRLSVQETASLLGEEETMLEETIARWSRELRDEGREEGREEGLLRGRRETLGRLLALKFGERPGRAQALEALTTQALEVLESRLLAARSESGLFTPRTPPSTE